MRHEYLDAYSRPPRSFIHRLPPGFKLSVALLVVCGVSFAPPSLWPLTQVRGLTWLHVGVALAIVGTTLAARIPLAFVVSRVVMFAPFPLLLGASVPISNGFNAESLRLMTTLVAKCVLSFATMLVLVNTTPFDRLLAAMRVARAPVIVLATLAFMYRYLFILLDEHARIRRAQFARSFRRAGKWRMAASAIGSLLARSFDRSERVYSAMLARGYDGQPRSLD